MEKQPIPRFNLKVGAEPLTNWLAAIACLVDEPEIRISKDGLAIRMMDPSRVAMIDSSYPSTEFEEYEVTVEGVIRFDMKRVLRYVKRAGKEDNISLTVDDKGLLVISVVDQGRVWRMTTVTPEYEELSLPKITLNAGATITSDKLLEMLEDVNLVTDNVKFIASPDELRAEGKSDLDRAEHKLTKSNQASLDFFTEEKASSIHPLSYLIDIAKAAKKIHETVQVRLAKDMPVKLIYGKTTFICAPRIEVE